VKSQPRSASEKDRAAGKKGGTEGHSGRGRGIAVLIEKNMGQYVRLRENKGKEEGRLWGLDKEKGSREKATNDDSTVWKRYPG